MLFGWYRVHDGIDYNSSPSKSVDEQSLTPLARYDWVGIKPPVPAFWDVSTDDGSKKHPIVTSDFEWFYQTLNNALDPLIEGANQRFGWVTRGLFSSLREPERSSNMCYGTRAQTC